MDMLTYHFNRAECFFLILQLGLIACVLLAWTRRLRWPTLPPSMTACLLAICAGWCCRLAGVFVLTSAGFTYPQSDDPCRWILSWKWIHSPCLLTGFWTPGTSILHGLAMRVVDNPLAASKLVSVLFCLLPLVGIFLFTVGVFADRRLACAAVLAGAPLWLHVILSTGAMSEMPTVTFMLSGCGLLLLGLRKPPGARFWRLAIAALSFNLSASFHLTAWVYLAAVLAALLAYALSLRGQASGFHAGHWLIFSIASSLFCLVYLVGCWFKFGHPFEIFKLNTAQLLKDNGFYPWNQRLYAYPLGLAYTHRAVLPLLVFGIVWSWVAKRGERGVRRGVLLAIGLALLVIMGTTLGGAVSIHGYRATIVLSTALIPFMLAPFFSGVDDAPGGSQPPYRPLHIAQKLTLAGFAALSVCCFLSINYRYCMERIKNVGTDTVAVGAWLRQEMIQPRVLKRRDLTLPVRIHKPVGVDFNIYPLVYEAQFLNKLEIGDKDSIETVRPGQIFVSPVRISDPRAQSVTQVGSFFIYRLQGRK